MAANHKTAHVDNVRERKAARLEGELASPPVRPERPAKDEARAQASAASASAGAESVADKPKKATKAKKTKKDTQGFEKPITFGGIDG